MAKIESNTAEGTDVPRFKHRLFLEVLLSKSPKSGPPKWFWLKLKANPKEVKVVDTWL